jgi:carbamoyltransferase
MKVLGISCYYHDSAACLIDDGTVVAAAQEERFTRIKHDQSFPHNAIRYCLAEAGGSGGRLDAVAFYDKPILKFHRILETYFSVAPSGLRSFMKAVPLWTHEKLWIEPRIEAELEQCGLESPGKIYFPSHHASHAASAFFPSPFPEAAVLTIDGVGEWATATVAVGEGNRLQLLEQLAFPHSLGLLYSAFTYFAGFTVNSDEYKMMGLAPYGEGTYTDVIKHELMDIKEDGSFRLNMEYFGYLDELVMTSQKFETLFGGPARKPETPITQREMDMARSVQEVTEEIVLRMAGHARARTGKEYLCLAGGVALNCVANGRILREGIFKDLWIQPAAGDAGGSIGAAMSVWHDELGNPRHADGSLDAMQGALLGPEFSSDQIKEFLDAQDCSYRELPDEEWAPTIAQLIADEKVVGLFQGRMEFGPRALGNRSIVGDARSPEMQSVMNQKIKFRESFRPFAPSCLEERLADYFEIDRPSPYMLLVAPLRKEERFAPVGDERSLEIHERANRQRSKLPAITHVDYSARLQSVNPETNERYYRLLKAFDEKTGCGVIVNTSFNVRDEPIVCTPEDAFQCFMRTGMDALSLGPFLLEKLDGLGSQDAGKRPSSAEPDSPRGKD